MFKDTKRKDKELLFKYVELREAEGEFFIGKILELIGLVSGIVILLIST